MMKNRMDFYKKGNDPSNYLKLKSLLSILTIGIFIFFGFASIEEGDPTTEIVDCELLHASVTLTQKCTIKAYYQNGDFAPGVVVNLLISEYDKVDDNGFCNLVLKNSYNRRVITQSDGTVSFYLNSKTYVSNDDEIQINYRTYDYGYYTIVGTRIINKYYPAVIIDFNLLASNQYP